MEDKLSDIATGCRDLAQDIDHRFENLDRDKAWSFTVDHLSDRVGELEQTVSDLKEELEQMINDKTGD